MLWLLVMAVAVGGAAIIAAILTSGPSSEAILPPEAAATDVPLAQPTGPITSTPPNGDGGGGSSAPDGEHGTGSAADDGGAGDRAPPSSKDAGGVPAGWSEVTRGFGLAFTRTSVGRDAWFAAMSSWLTPEQAAEYRDVAIDTIPTGELVEIEVADPGPAAQAHGRLTYDTGMVLEVGLSYRAAAGGWLVARVELAETAGQR
ncbi:hypothetical protein E1262_20380 [Jiangella aurantiaca]|uniref:Uncharacterized protein n=1 Tax=Jiangella aurantiaca TaxID=2530373 RepID=A0A4R5A4X0_9ACTN|nr:hypothetical protein [Jiangella aurantiaca]TDD66983.1 hypothetical protein E1262_20380 [Jiangella aurantiaca]